MSKSRGPKESKVDLTPGAGFFTEQKTAEVSLPEEQIPQAQRVQEILCDLCGRPTRIFTNSQGIHSSCGSCRRVIQVARSQLNLRTQTRPRGLSKQVIVSQTGGE